MIRSGIRRAFRLALRRRDQWERDVEDEIKLHLALRAEQLVAQGHSGDDAYSEAVRRFGPLTQSRARLLEAARHREEHMQRTEVLSDLRQDVAFALRTLGRQKAWTAVTITTLALGIAATTAVFSVLSTFLLHPVPYPGADRVVYVDQQPTSGNNTGIQVTITPSTRAIRAWQQGAYTFEALEAASIGPMSLKTTSGEPSRVMSAQVLPTFPAFAGQRPILGRMFTAVDISRKAKLAVLGEPFWRERLGADPNVLGKAITLNDSLYVVIGVLPGALRFGGAGRAPIDVWRPLDLNDDKLGAALIGRLRPGATLEGAQRELDSLFRRAAGNGTGPLSFRTVVSRPAQRVQFRDSLVLLTGAVALVLLVACTNVAHLLLARSATRQREMAIRAALGAGRGRLLRQLLTESFLISVAGTSLGVFGGWAGLRALIAMRPVSHDELRVAQLDATTLLVAIAVAALSAIVFGVIGGLQSARQSTHDALKTGASSVSATRHHRRMRSILVVSEMALSAMLIVGAALVVRSLQRLQSTDLGFEPRGLYSITMDLAPRFPTPAARAAFLQEFTTRLRALPSVHSVAVVQAGPGSRSFTVGRLEIEGEAPPPTGTTSFIDVNHIQPTYFQTMGARLVEGATFGDSMAAVQQIIVNESFARKHWARGTAVGRRLRVAQKGDEPWFTIVGVAQDVHTSGPVSESTAPVLYQPPVTLAFPTILIRASGDAGALASAATIARQLGLRTITIDPVERFLYRALSEPRFVTLVMTVFGLIGLTLAAIGLYGVMAYTVAQQWREIGIRVALGASRSHIVRKVLVRGTSLAVIGAFVGLAAASWGTKLLQSQLYGITRLDPLSFAIGATVLIGAAMLACIVPTRRALAVDPVTAIRAE